VIEMGTYCVTGVASGIGRATKLRLEADGHRVIGVDVRDADVVADLSSPAGRQVAVDGVLAACGGALDGLVPAAGVSFPQMSEDKVVAVNYYGVMALLAGLKPALERGTDAAVVLVSSNSTTMTPGLRIEDAEVYLQDEATATAHFSKHGYLCYPAGKLAIAFWVRRNAVSPDWIGKGIRINAVAPGVIDTNMTRPLLEMPGMADALQQIPIPAGRWGKPDEIAEAAAFLLSPKSAYVVGQILFVDGGTDAVLQPTAHPHPLPGKPS
jgi:NAD(P)-dependent dehydrogenase (short-subunit alcohol dehydrogenase family)